MRKLSWATFSPALAEFGSRFRQVTLQVKWMSDVTSGSDGSEVDRRLELLGRVAEAGRLARAGKLVGEVVFQVADRELVIAGVGKYNVVIDGNTQRVLHGCRDAQSQAREGMLCKHVAAVLLALEESHALEIIEGLLTEQGAWHLDIIQ